MGVKIISKNSRAGYDFFIEEKYECGVVLAGTEVKSLREGKAPLMKPSLQLTPIMKFGCKTAQFHNICLGTSIIILRRDMKTTP